MKSCEFWISSLSALVQVGGSSVEIVDTFTYLRSQLNSSGGSALESNRRISITRSCMQMFDRRIWRSKISTHTKLRLYNVYILPVFLYGAETWSITKAIERRINTLDQWCLRRILNITWSEHVTNTEIHRRTGQPLLSDIVRARRLKLFGHLAQADKSQDHSHALRACIWHSPKNWKRHLGRPRHTWLRTVEADLHPFNLGLASGFKKAQDRTTWRTLTRTAMSPTSPEWVAVSNSKSQHRNIVTEFNGTV